MTYNSYYMPIEIGLEHVDHVDLMRHDAVRHVDIVVAAVHYDHDEDDDDRVVDMVVVAVVETAVMMTRRKKMQHYLMMTTTTYYYLMVVAVANIQLQRLQKRDIVVVDVCEDGRDDSLDDDDDGVDNLYKLDNDEEEQSELFGDGVHADLMTLLPQCLE